MKLAAIILALVLLAGCSREPSTFTPAPRSVETANDVTNDAIVWAARDPANRFYAPVAASHSMEPVITSRSLVLCVRYRGQQFANGAVAVYNYSAQYPRMMHVVSDQNATHVYMSGSNNRVSDGWQPKTRIEALVVGQLYLP